MTFQQCELRRERSTFTSWIPSTFAKVGKTLDFKDEGAGWLVTAVHPVKLTSDQVKALATQHRRFATVLS